jgi:hypothetical protein
MMGVGIGVQVDRWFEHHVRVSGTDLYDKVIREVAKYIGSEVKRAVARAA